MVCIVHQYYCHDKMKEDEVGWTCIMALGHEICIRYFNVRIH
jgi:hypothetical protein